jgi:hypothetical protein
MVLLLGLALLAVLALVLFTDKTRRLVDSVLHMGHMRTLGSWGFEWWGEMRPAAMWMNDGRCFKPLFLGIWIRNKGADRSPVAEV